MCVGSLETEIQTEQLLKQLSAQPDEIFGREMHVSELQELLVKRAAAMSPRGKSVPAQ